MSRRSVPEFEPEFVPSSMDVPKIVHGCPEDRPKIGPDVPKIGPGVRAGVRPEFDGCPEDRMPKIGCPEDPHPEDLHPGEHDRAVELEQTVLPEDQLIWA